MKTPRKRSSAFKVDISLAPILFPHVKHFEHLINGRLTNLTFSTLILVKAYAALRSSRTKEQSGVLDTLWFAIVHTRVRIGSSASRRRLISQRGMFDKNQSTIA